MASRRNLKRKSPEKYEEDGAFVFPLDELNQDLLERVLSWLPTSTFLSLSSVCKRWKSAATSPVFHSACSQIPTREPWFYMVDSSQSSHFKNQQQFVYDSAEMKWKFLNSPSNFLEEKQQNESNLSNFLPVAASSGLLCFHNEENGEFLISNPVTSSFRKLPSLDYSNNTLCAIGMYSTQESYKVYLIFGETPNLSFRVYNSTTNTWEDSQVLSRKPSQSFSPDDDDEEEDSQMLYFLSKCGNVVATEIQKTPCKQYSSITTTKDRQEILCFLNSSGKVVVCNFAEKHFFEYPRLLPLHNEYSIDLVECGGEIFVVVLSEFLETASLRIWKFDEKEWTWNQVFAMPAAISHEFYGKKLDINCSGSGEQLFVCISNSFDESCRYFLCNLAGNEWTELPACYRKFSCAFSFQPRIEASV
ncbi:F-box only protein 13 [Lycium barbarum]|uniref:F-box only protein 13 n=1 Tax=Lycium barbarum TaxID=112863 RepID=UPI00293F079D|nr:F-box only protein 13 [Lycium barbarum]